MMQREYIQASQMQLHPKTNQYGKRYDVIYCLNTITEPEGRSAGGKIIHCFGAVK